MALAVNARLKKKGEGRVKTNCVPYATKAESSVAFCVGRGGKLCPLLKTVQTSELSMYIVEEAVE